MGFTSPQLLGTASLIGQIGGVASSAIGGYYGAQTQKINMGAQAAMAESNARIAEAGAQSVLLQGRQQAGALTLQAGQLKSRQRVALAANGVDLGVGSAAELQASTDVMAGIDANTLLANAVRSAWGYRAQGVNYQNEALVARASAKAVKPGAGLAASLLSGASNVAASWLAMKGAGMFDGGEDIARANRTDDPIYALGTSRKWW